ncbi:MAG: hypothetical protein Q9211_000061 [Gyalolechia sp. 1 TL-2023]
MYAQLRSWPTFVSHFIILFILLLACCWLSHWLISLVIVLACWRWHPRWDPLDFQASKLPFEIAIVAVTWALLIYFAYDYCFLEPWRERVQPEGLSSGLSLKPPGLSAPYELSNVLSPTPPQSISPYELSAASPTQVAAPAEIPALQPDNLAEDVLVDEKAPKVELHFDADRNGPPGSIHSWDLPYLDQHHDYEKPSLKQCSNRTSIHSLPSAHDVPLPPGTSEALSRSAKTEPSQSIRSSPVQGHQMELRRKRLATVPDQCPISCTSAWVSESSSVPAQYKQPPLSPLSQGGSNTRRPKTSTTSSHSSRMRESLRSDPSSSGPGSLWAGCPSESARTQIRMSQKKRLCEAGMGWEWNNIPNVEKLKWSLSFDDECLEIPANYVDEWKKYEWYVQSGELRNTQPIRVYGAPELYDLDLLKCWVNWNMHRDASRSSPWPPGYKPQNWDLEGQSQAASLYP